MKTLFIALRAAIFGSGFILLWGWVALGLHHRYDTSLGFALAGWTRVLGVALMAAGGTLAFACVATFVARGEGTPAPFDPPRKFVAAGPYKFVRNPMYVGVLAMVLGEAALYRAGVLLGYAGALLLTFHLFVVTYEEPTLRRKFGASHERYCASVPRWLPRLRPWIG